MDWKQILSLSNENLTDERKEEIYVELIKDQKFDSKISKKLFPLCQIVLRYKGQQVEKQREEIEMFASSEIDLKSTLDQIDKQKKIISKYEVERAQFKSKIKELSDEIAMIHGRDLHGSDEDSPDQLSEIDKQQELMGKISAKNKHIKRLLRDVEKYEQKSTSYLKMIEELKSNIHDLHKNSIILNTQLEDSTSGVTFLEDKISQLTNQLQEQETQNHQLLKEFNNRDKEMEKFSLELEERMQIYKGILDEKQLELDTINEKYNNLVEQIPGIDIDSEQSEKKRLIDSIKERNELIMNFEQKIKILSENLMESTETIKKMKKEKDEYTHRSTQNKAETCCNEVQMMLERSNERCKELQEMLEMAEDDNMLKAKQAFDAVETLRSYETSKDGLAKALKKIYKLQETVHQREKQIRELVVDLNAQNEIVAENSILRKRLGISDEDVIETKAFLAKQKRFTKINDSLMLKLRASEELRLQLKLDKNDLKRKIYELEEQIDNGLKIPNSSTKSNSPSTSENTKNKCIENKSMHKLRERTEIKNCDNCNMAYNIYESIKYCHNCIMKQTSNLCENCTNNAKVTSTENIELIKKIAKLEIDYQSVLDENENLRAGLNEILEKLRDYEGSSEKTVISSATLEKLLYILNLRHHSKAETVEVSKEINIPSDNQNEKVQSEDQNETLHLKLLLKNVNEENEDIKVKLERMQHFEIQYEELVKCSELSDDDKDHLLVKSFQRCHDFEMNLEIYERKIEFLKNENDNLHKELRMLKISSLKVLDDMKKEVSIKAKNIFENQTSDEGDFKNDLEDILSELHEIRSEINIKCFNVLNNIKILDEKDILKIDIEKLSDIQILENNFTTTFITRKEYNDMKLNLVKMHETIKTHEAKEKYFEELAEISQHQFNTQQLLLSQFSDDEISARHLIVDLQSQSNEKYLLTKMTRDAKIAKENEDRMQIENDGLKNEIKSMKENLLKAQKAIEDKSKEIDERENNNLLKIRYLKKSLIDLCNQYSTMTPIYKIADFLKHYMALLDAKKHFDVEVMKMRSQSLPDVTNDLLIEQLKEMSLTDIEAKIEIIKHKSSSEYLKQQLEMSESTIRELHNEISRIKINEIKNVQHWNTLRMLFDNQYENDENVKIEKHYIDKEVQVEISKRDCETNTENELSIDSQAIKNPTIFTSDIQLLPSTTISSNGNQSKINLCTDDEPNSLERQLAKALSLASSRSSLLIETENQLSEAQGRIKILEKNLENQHKQLQPQSHVDKSVKKEDHILSSTIAKLQGLILEKDTTLSRYQELLKTERQQNIRTYDDMSDEIKQLKKFNDSLEMTVEELNKNNDKLKFQIIDLKSEKTKAAGNGNSVKPTSPVHHLQSQHVTFNDIELRSMEIKLKESQNEIKKMEQQLKDFTNIERQLQNVILEKEIAIKDLNIKLKASNDNLDTLSENFTSTTEIDQLRDMLEEKDKHITDLSETLNQFHDDQQRYINDTAINSAEQVHMISSDLTRSEASNRILKTQLEALKRQVTNIQQREKQSRDMIKTLKNQLIRRPVISVKNDKRHSTAREEQQQKKISELENELMETKDELRRQVNINDNKKAKNAAELGLWDKQKRYQELSEKLKGKLTEKEIDFERMKANFQIAKNNITRLEKEKIMLENKVKSGRYLQSIASSSMTSSSHNQMMKNLETPSLASDVPSDINHELIAALKSRIESQQRRIVAFELEGKGSNAYVMEVEKLHEEISSVQARNIRLEAKNIQLHMENDLLNQNDCGQRQEARIKHLEDYILILKDELAQSHASSMPEKLKQNDSSVGKLHAMEQTILNLKLIIEKLQAENKYLRSTKHPPSVPSTPTYMKQSDRKKEEVFEKIKTEYENLQKSHKEALDKISSMQIELELSLTKTISASCPHCDRKSLDDYATQDVDALKQQLQQKTAILEKAKSLLTRAAAREKQLRERINQLRKKCSALEGVPDISEENSESG